MQGIMNRFIFCLMAVALYAGPTTGAVADTLLVSDNPEPYVVRRGDTLWDIAGRFLTKPWRWPELWKINNHIENPHLIYPGDIVRLVFFDGQPQLILDRGGIADGGGAAGGQDQQGQDQQGQDQQGQEQMQGQGELAADLMASDAMSAAKTGARDFKLSPKVREHLHDRQAIPPISIEKIQPFLSYMLVISDDDYKGWPYVLTNIKNGRSSIVMGDESATVHVRGKLNRSVRKYSIYREARELRSSNHPAKVLGLELRYVGDFIVSDYASEGVRGFVVNQELPVEKGDRIYPYVEEGRDKSLDFVPHAPPKATRGQIIAILDGVYGVGGNQIVALDVGKKDGVRPGALMHMYNRAVAFEDEVSARLRTEQQAKERIRFKGEDSNLMTKAFSEGFNRIRDFKNAFDATPLVSFLGSPQATPDKVSVPPEYNGQLMVFRSFEHTSYALVLNVSTPSYIEDLVFSPEFDVREEVTAGL